MNPKCNMPKKRKTRGILGVPQSTQFFPFSNHCELFSSDSNSSDSEYEVRPRDTASSHKTRSKRKYKRSIQQQGDTSKGNIVSTQISQKGDSKDGMVLPVLTISLPSEIVYRILCYAKEDQYGPLILCRAARVCRIWNNASQNVQLWSSLDLSFMSTYRRATSATLKNLVKLKGKSIASLNLNGWTKINDDILKIVLEACPHLSSLSLSKCQMKDKRNITNVTTTLLSNRTECMKRLNLSWIQTDATSNLAVRGFLQANKGSLQHLNLAGCTLVSSVIFADIKVCNNLKILDLSSTSIDRLNIKDLQISCPLMEELYLTNLRLLCNAKGNVIADKVDCFCHLTVLSVGCIISSVSSINDDALTEFTQGATALRILDVRGLVTLTHNSFENLEAINLERLFLSKVKVSRESLSAILSKWGSSLIELDLAWTVFGNDSKGNSCAVVFQDFKLPNLELLHLQGTSITDDEVSCVVQWSPNLSHLDLTSCRSVSRGRKRCHRCDDIKLLRRDYSKKK